jgi:hypothetical protein
MITVLFGKLMSVHAISWHASWYRYFQLAESQQWNRKLARERKKICFKMNLKKGPYYQRNGVQMFIGLWN